MMDKIDLQILDILQKDCTLAIADIGKQVGLSATPCWRRIQKLEEKNYIQKRVALLNARKLKSNVVVFITVSTNDHSVEWIDRFNAVVQSMPEIVESYRMSGAANYFLRVIVPDIDTYDRFYKDFCTKVQISEMTSEFAMEQIKRTSEVPLKYVQAELPERETEAA